MSQEMIQILRPDGSVVDPSFEPKLSEKELKHLYRTMVLTRALDERGLTLQRQGKIGFYVTSTGQEAVAGSGLALNKSDWVFPAYREHAVGLLRGLPLDVFIGQLFGNSGDLIKGRQMPNHFAHKETNYVSISSPIGTQISHAAGAALASKIRNDKNVMLTFFGDGGTSSNDFHAGLNFAGALKAPCIFYCSNNQYAISVPLEKQTAQPIIVEKASAYGIRGVRVDGNDALAIYQVTKEAADRAREGAGPTLIEAVTFRMGAHSSSDDAKVYCPQSKFDEWAKKDPIDRFKAYLKNKKIWSDKEDEALVETIKAEISASVEKIQKMGPPTISSLFDDVFKEMPLNLKQQKEALLEEARQKGGKFTDSSEAFPL